MSLGNADAEVKITNVTRQCRGGGGLVGERNGCFIFSVGFWTGNRLAKVELVMKVEKLAQNPAQCTEWRLVTATLTDWLWSVVVPRPCTGVLTAKMLNVDWWLASEPDVPHCAVLQTTNEKASIHERIAFLNEASVMKWAAASVFVWPNSVDLT